MVVGCVYFIMGGLIGGFVIVVVMGFLLFGIMVINIFCSIGFCFSLFFFDGIVEDMDIDVIIGFCLIFC